MRRRWVIAGLLILLGLLTFTAAQAHATLVRSEPPANSVLAQPPTEIRLWFSESVEPKFSAFVLLDSSGKSVATPVSQPDPSDALQLFMHPGLLSNGLYTVVWHTVSAADGHATQGSFAFTVGPAVATAASQTVTVETIPPDGALIRWLNLFSMSLAVGSIGFVLFVWTPTIQTSDARLDHGIHRVIWAGWILLGAAGLLMLLLQVSLAAQVSVLGAISDPALTQVITETRYGSLWLARMTLWVFLGIEIFLATARKNRVFYWLALVLGAAILLTNSLFSHASAAEDSLAAVASDWVHLSMTALWIGGLVQFINVIVLLRRTTKPALPTLEKLVGYFSNFARVAVAGLILTGLYAAWLEVGSVEALLTTLYGQALLVKLLLILPLLGIAAINLFYTHRGLQAGQPIWAGRLKGLISAEIVLTVGVLAAVGAMTSLSPARTTLAQRASTAAPAANPIQLTQTVDGANVRLLIAPGWLGQNTFTLTLSDAQGNPVNDVSLIRLRFDDQTDNLGQSELRIQPTQNSVGNGSYSVSGANLSQAGTWRIRVTVQRPNQYDTLVDFKPQVRPTPPPTTPAGLDTQLPFRVPILLLTGLVILGVGGFFAAHHRFLSGAGLLSRILILVGAVFLVNALVVFAPSIAPNAANVTQSTTASASAACAGIQSDMGSGGQIVVDKPGAPAAIHIASPADGATLTTGQVDLQITTDNLTIGQQQHLHTYVDGKMVSMDYTAAVKLENLLPGIHDICVVVGDAAHADTSVKDGIRVVVKAAATP